MESWRMGAELLASKAVIGTVPQADPARRIFWGDRPRDRAQFWDYWSARLERMVPGASFQESLAMFGLPLRGPVRGQPTMAALCPVVERRFEMQPGAQWMGRLGRAGCGRRPTCRTTAITGNFIKLGGLAV